MQNLEEDTGPWGQRWGWEGGHVSPPGAASHRMAAGDFSGVHGGKRDPMVGFPKRHDPKKCAPGGPAASWAEPLLSSRGDPAAASSKK